MIRRPGRPVSGDQWRNKYLQQLRVGSEPNAASLVSEFSSITVVPPSSSSFSSSVSPTPDPVTTNDTTVIPPSLPIPPSLSSSAVPIQAVSSGIPSSSTGTTTVLNTLSTIKKPKTRTKDNVNLNNNANNNSNTEDDDIFGYSMEGVQSNPSMSYSRQGSLTNVRSMLPEEGDPHPHHHQMDHPQPQPHQQQFRHLSNADSSNNDDTTTVSSVDDQNYTNDTITGIQILPVPPSESIPPPLRPNPMPIPSATTTTTHTNSLNISGTSWKSSSTSTTPTINGRIYMEAQSYDSEDSLLILPSALGNVSTTSLKDSSFPYELSHSIPETMAPVYELARLHSSGNSKHQPPLPSQNEQPLHASTTTGSSSTPTGPMLESVQLHTNSIPTLPSLAHPSDTIIPSPRKVPSTSILHPTVEEEEEDEED